MSRSRRRRSPVAKWLGSGLAAAAVVGTGTLVWSPPASADASSFYEASARSAVADGYFTNSTIPGGVKPEGGGPETDVAQSSLSKGDANASFPYFGDYVPTAPGVVSGLFGFPVPPYPLTASSTFGSEAGKANYPGIELSAVSRANSTVADGVFGSAGSGAVSHSEVDQTADNQITAAAVASSPLTNLGPLVSVKGLESTVSVVADATGALTRTSNFSIDEISVPGLVLRIPERTPGSVPVPFPVPVPGVPAPQPIPLQPFPIPNGGTTLVEPRIGFINGYFVVTQPFGADSRKYVVPADAVVQAFKAQGVALNYTAAALTKNGIAGGVFAINYTFAAPPDNPFYKGPTPTTFILGATSASVQRAAQAGAVVAAAASGNSAVPGVLPGGPLAQAPDVANVVVPATAPALGPVPTTVGGIPAVNFQPQHPGVVSGIRSTLMAAGLPAFAASDFSGLYLALVGLAGLGLVAVTVVVAKGVSARWN
jgi:hypothetical protein